MSHRLIIIFLSFLICFNVKGQEKSEMNDDVFFYLIENVNGLKKTNEYYPLTLLIDNQSEDSLLIENFNKLVFHKLDFLKENKAFSWEFLTTSNQTPVDMVIITGGKPNGNISENDNEIVIPPYNIYTSDIFIQYSSFIKYAKGYYKLCLIFNETEKYVAELIIKIE